MAEQSGIERRRLKRYVVQRVPVSIQAGPVGGVGYIKNVSKGGLFIRSDLLPAQGETVEVTIEPIPERKITVTGVVCWTTAAVPPEEGTPQPGFGIRLEPVTDAYLVFYEELLLR